MAVIGYILVSLSGLAVGWLANIVAQRLPNENRPLFGHLHCVRSGEKLRWYDTLPLFGYLAQGGKCRHCGKKLPLRFVVLESLILVCLLVAWPLYTPFGLGAYFFNAFAMVLLITIGAIDWRLRLIFPIMIYLGLLVAFLAPLIAPGTQGQNSRVPENLWSVGGGMLLGAGFFLLIYWLALSIYRVRALGFGDVLLAMLIGAESGFPQVVSVLFLGSIIGGIAALIIYVSGRKKSHDFIPYGTWMCVGAVLNFIFGNAVWQFGPLRTLAGLLDLIFTIVSLWINRVFV